MICERCGEEEATRIVPLGGVRIKSGGGAGSATYIGERCRQELLLALQTPISAWPIILTRNNWV